MEHASPHRSSSVVLDDAQISVGSRLLLRPTSLTIPAGELTVLVGASGAGKTMLLRMLAGLVDEDVLQCSGQVCDQDGAPLRHVGIVFQQHALFDDFSTAANIQFAIDHGGDEKSEMSADRWLEELHVPKHVAVSSLSGGQKQRLAIARTLASGPRVILYDEPTSGLDAASAQQAAKLIQRMQAEYGRTSIVVTHDYATLIPIADNVLLLDPATQSLTLIDRSDWGDIATRMEPSVPSSMDESAKQTTLGAAGDFFESTGNALMAMVRLPIDTLIHPPVTRWSRRFLLQYIKLIAGFSAIVYLMIAGVIVGFSTTYFTFQYLPFALYTKPLLMEDLLSSIGFALYRILVPVMATILIAARCGAAAAADVGVKKYGLQIEAMRTFDVVPKRYLLAPIVFAFVVSTPILEWLCFQSAKWTSMATFVYMHPNVNVYFWDVHFSSELESSSFMAIGSGWVILKNVISGIGIAAIAYYRGSRSKQSTRDVSDSITSTVLWTTILVLLVHFTVALLEF